MKVIVNGRVYDANREPICIVLTPAAKEHISNMAPEARFYLAFPKPQDGTDGDEGAPDAQEVQGTCRELRGCRRGRSNRIVGEEP